MRHELKTWPIYFEASAADRKKFELRKADRNFCVGDELVLKEWDPDLEQYTGRVLTKLVLYKIEGGIFGLEVGFCILGF